MRRTVNLPDDLDARLKHEAKRRRVTVSELAREAVETYLGTRPTGRHDRTEIESTIERLFRQIMFIIPTEDVELSRPLRTYERWDSLSHMELVLAIEASFAMEFSTDDLTECRSLSDFASAVMERTG